MALPGGGVPVSLCDVESVVELDGSAVVVVVVSDVVVVVEEVVVEESEVDVALVEVSEVEVAVVEVVLAAVVVVVALVPVALELAVLDGCGEDDGDEVALAGGPVVVCVAEPRTVTVADDDSWPSLTVRVTRKAPVRV